MAEETKETKGFRSWAREHLRGLIAAGVVLAGLGIYGYSVRSNVKQNEFYRQGLVGIVREAVQRDPNIAKFLISEIKPREPPKEVKEEEKEIEREAKEIAQDTNKYALVLEKRMELEEDNEKLTAERNSLRQDYDKLTKAQAPLKDEFTKTLTDYKALSDAKSVLEAKQKDLIKQIADMNDTNVKFANENTKLSKAYFLESEARKKADANSVDANAKLVKLNEQYKLLTEEKEKLEKAIIEKYVPALDSYNILRQRGIFMQSEGVEIRRPRVPSAPRSEASDIGLRQINRIRRQGLEIVFFDGNIDAAEKVDYRTTNRYSDEQLRDIMNVDKGYAFFGDFNGDGIKDLLYDGDITGQDKLKKGKAGGKFAPAEIIPNETALQILGF